MLVYLKLGVLLPPMYHAGISSSADWSSSMTRVCPESQIAQQRGMETPFMLTTSPSLQQLQTGYAVAARVNEATDGLEKDFPSDGARPVWRTSRVIPARFAATSSDTAVPRKPSQLASWLRMGEALSSGIPTVTVP